MMRGPDQTNPPCAGDDLMTGLTAGGLLLAAPGSFPEFNRGASANPLTTARAASAITHETSQRAPMEVRHAH